LGALAARAGDRAAEVTARFRPDSPFIINGKRTNGPSVHATNALM
jgi:hypothetical protein